MVYRKVPVIIVDPQPLFRLALKNVLDANDKITVYGAVGSAQTGLDLLQQYRPGVVVADLELAAALESSLPGSTELVALAADTSPRSVVRAVSIGALSLLHKSVDPVILTRAVHNAARGERTWHLDDDADSAPAFVTSKTHLGPTALTNRETEVFAMLLRRMTNEEIAEELFLARQTVKNYVSSILQKLGMPTRTHLFREYAKTDKQLNGKHTHTEPRPTVSR